MREITLVVVPGTGARRITLAAGATWQDVITAHQLEGRSLFADGIAVDPTSYQYAIPGTTQDLFATGAVKGNF